MKTTRTLTIAAIFAAVTLTLALNTGHSSEQPKTAENFQSAPAGNAYPVPAASEVQWRPTFDVNPDAVHDLSMPRS